MALLSDGRFRLGLGAGENLNEHVTGGGWPPVNVRHAMLAEAVDIITALWQGGYVTFLGERFEVDSAKLWDLPDTPPPLGIAVSGRQSCDLAGRSADLMVAVEPDAELGTMFDQAGGAGKSRVGQVPVCFDVDTDAAVDRAPVGLCGLQPGDGRLRGLLALRALLLPGEPALKAAQPLGLTRPGTGSVEHLPSEVATVATTPASRPTLRPVGVRSSTGWGAEKLTCQRPERSEVTLAIPCSVGNGRDRRKRTGPILGTCSVAHRRLTRSTDTSRTQKPSSVDPGLAPPRAAMGGRPPVAKRLAEVPQRLLLH